MAASAPNVDVVIGGYEVPDADFISYTVERDMYQPDAAAVVLSNQNDVYTADAHAFKVGQPMEIFVGGGSSRARIFVGEVLGLEPIYRGGDTTKVCVRAVNKLHRLLRFRKSLTFQDMNDQAIIGKVIKDANLSLEWKHEKSITYKHVYQHNLNGLEFVRMRAARMGCHMWCVDQTLHVKEPNLNDKTGIKLGVDKDGALRVFTPRQNSATVIKKVTVKGWNPETKELIVGEAEAQNSPLGKEKAVDACSEIGAQQETFTVDHPIWSKDEADALAKARLRDLNLSFITGEAECAGNPAFELGKTVEIEANSKYKPDQDPFNGNYYIMGVTHRHTLPKAKEGGFISILKLARDAQKKA